MLRILAVVGLLMSAVLPASAQFTSYNGSSIFVSITSPPTSIKWSVLGVVADGATDNTSALNALPVGERIAGDCPAASFIKLNSAWLLRSNLTIQQQSSCPIVSYVSGNGSYAITQSDLTTPLTYVSIDGLQISKSAAVTGERIIEAWINHFTLTNFTIGASGGFAFIRGSDQEIAHGVVTGMTTDTGAPGIRHIGNVPKVTTTPGRSANVWIHDNNITSGDSTYQACQPLNTSLWTNVSTDDIMYENNSGSSAGVYAIVGLNSAFPNFTCSNIVYKNNAATSVGNEGVLITSSASPNTVSSVTFQNQVFNAAGQTSINPVLNFDSNGGVISNILFDNVTINSPNRQSLGFSGTGFTDITFQNGVIGAPLTSSQPNVSLSNVLRAKIQNNTISALAGDPIFIGAASGSVSAPSDYASILNNIIINVPQNRSGVELVSSDHATITGNTITPTTGTTHSKGITLSAAGTDSGPGTTNATVTGNDVSAVTNSPKIICATGQGNTVTGNTGASDCAP